MSRYKVTPRLFSAEQRAQSLAKRKALVAAGAHYKRDWLDALFWDTEAKKRGIRLPAWWVAPTPTSVRWWFKKLRQDEEFEHVYGDRMTASKLIELNPTMPLRAFVGQMLEEARG